jgi:hypothetical protein
MVEIKTKNIFIDGVFSGWSPCVKLSVWRKMEVVRVPNRAASDKIKPTPKTEYRDKLVRAIVNVYSEDPDVDGKIILNWTFEK